MDKKTVNFVAGAGFGLLAALIWGSWPVISKMSTMQQLNFLDITAIRFFVAGCLLLPILLFNLAKTKKWLLRGVFLSIGAGVPYVLTATYGLSIAPSSHFGIIAPSSMLLFTSLGCVIFLKEKLSRSRMLGMILIFIGVISVSLNNLQALSMDTALGDLLFIGCGLLWSSYTILCKYWNIDAWMATALVSVVSMCAFLPIYVVNFSSSLKEVPLSILLQQGFFQGVLAAILALYCYSKAVALLGSSRGAIFAALVPPITLFLSVILLQEVITWVEQLGLILVCCGILLALEIIVRLPFLGDKKISN